MPPLVKKVPQQDLQRRLRSKRLLRILAVGSRPTADLRTCRTTRMSIRERQHGRSQRSPHRLQGGQSTRMARTGSTTTTSRRERRCGSTRTTRRVLPPELVARRNSCAWSLPLAARETTHHHKQRRRRTLAGGPNHSTQLTSCRCTRMTIQERRNGRSQRSPHRPRDGQSTRTPSTASITRILQRARSPGYIRMTLSKLRRLLLLLWWRSRQRQLPKRGRIVDRHRAAALNQTTRLTQSEPPRPSK